MKTDKDRERQFPSPPHGSHTSGTEWSMADLRRPVDILKTSSHINQHDTCDHIFQQYDMTENRFPQLLNLSD